MAIQPLHDRIILEAAAKEERSAGGIILPDAAQEKPQRGTVLAVLHCIVTGEIII